MAVLALAADILLALAVRVVIPLDTAALVGGTQPATVVAAVTEVVAAHRLAMVAAVEA